MDNPGEAYASPGEATNAFRYLKSFTPQQISQALLSQLSSDWPLNLLMMNTEAVYSIVLDNPDVPEHLKMAVHQLQSMYYFYKHLLEEGTHE